LWCLSCFQGEVTYCTCIVLLLHVELLDSAQQCIIVCALQIHVNGTKKACHSEAPENGLVANQRP